MSLLARRARRSRPGPDKRFNGMLAAASSFPMGTPSYADAISESEAAQKIAIWASWDLLCSLGSELPWSVFRGKGSDAVEVDKPSYMEDPGGEGYGYNDWAYMILQSYLSCGNVFGHVLARDPRGGFPIQVEPWPRSVMNATLENGKPIWTVQGREVPAGELWHQRAYPVAGSLLGLSPIGHHMTTIGQGISAGRFGYQFFLDGAHPSALLTNDETEIDEPQAKTVKERWMAVTSGSREPAVMGKGWKYAQVQISPEESQFLQTMRYTEAMCCRIYGPGIAEILGYNDEKSMQYSNVVDRRADVLVLSANKWFNRLERMLSAMLPRGQFARLTRNAMLQATTLDRFKAYELALKNRWQVVNEVRALEDLPPVEWGDEPNDAGGTAADTGGEPPQRRRPPIRAEVVPDPKASPPALRHMPGKHDQHKHGHKHGMDRVEGGDLIGDTSGAGAAVSAHEHARDTESFAGSGLGRNGDQLAHGLAEQQGFTGRPASKTKAEMDELVAEGHTEMFRGLHDAPAGSADELVEQTRSGGAYYGPGRQGSGIHSSSSETIADRYAVDTAHPSATGATVRMALHKDAKIVDHQQLVDEHRDFLDELDPEGASFPVYSDVGRYAIARGIDASRDVSHSGAPADAWDFTVYNRTALFVESE